MTMQIFAKSGKRKLRRPKRLADSPHTRAPHLALALRAARLGIFEFDKVKQEAYFSPLCLKITGLKDAGMRTLQDWIENIHPDDMHIIDKARCDARDGLLVDMVYRYRHPTRKTRWFHVCLRSRYNALGDLLHAIGIVADITDRKAGEEAEENLRLQREFMATIGHEVRTPLSGVIGMLELLKRTRLEPKQREYVVSALSAARSLVDDLNDILDYSKVYANKLLVERLPFRLRQMLDELEKQYEPLADSRGIDFRIDCNIAEQAHYMGDAFRIRQILKNLLNNAMKFTEQGFVHLTVRNEGSELIFAVSDSGIGIQPDALPRLFQAFSQMDASVSRRYGGTGLGLSICKRLAELMRGSMSVESEYGMGSTFTLRLPAPLMELNRQRQNDSISP